MDTLLNIIACSVRVATAIGFAALGGMLSERVRIINMGLEGMMLFGSFFGVVGSYFSGSAWIGLGLALVAGALVGLLHAVLTIEFKCEHILSSLGINMLASGLTLVLLEVIWKSKGSSSSVKGLGTIRLPIISQIPVIKEVIGTVSPLLILLIICVVFIYYILFRSVYGVRIRVIGDNPEVAGSLGINVYKIQYITLVCSGMLASLGGAYLSIGDINMFIKDMVSGRGYIALAMVVLGRWHPIGAVAVGLIYGMAEGMQYRLQSVTIAPQLVQCLPYLATLIVLLFARSGRGGPKAAGKHYYMKGQ